MDVNSPKDLERALNLIVDQLHELQAEAALTKVIAQYTIGVLVRNAADQKKYFEEIKRTSRENLATGLKFEGGDRAGNAKVRQKALDRHEQVFEEMGRALGLSDRGKAQ
jgi:hypothetical protein